MVYICVYIHIPFCETTHFPKILCKICHFCASKYTHDRIPSMPLEMIIHSSKECWLEKLTIRYMLPIALVQIWTSAYKIFEDQHVGTESRQLTRQWQIYFINSGHLMILQMMKEAAVQIPSQLPCKCRLLFGILYTLMHFYHNVAHQKLFWATIKGILHSNAMHTIVSQEAKKG